MTIIKPIRLQHVWAAEQPELFSVCTKKADMLNLERCDSQRKHPAQEGKGIILCLSAAHVLPNHGATDSFYEIASQIWGRHFGH